MNFVAAMPTMQRPIAAVAAQPSQHMGPVTNMTFGRRTSIIKRTITGAASTPLTTALQ